MFKPAPHLQALRCTLRPARLWYLGQLATATAVAGFGYLRGSHLERSRLKQGHKTSTLETCSLSSEVAFWSGSDVVVMPGSTRSSQMALYLQVQFFSNSFMMRCSKDDADVSCKTCKSFGSHQPWVLPLLLSIASSPPPPRHHHHHHHHHDHHHVPYHQCQFSDPIFIRTVSSHVNLRKLQFTS